MKNVTNQLILNKMKTLKILIFILLIGIFVGNSTTYIKKVDSIKELTINSNINIQSEFTVVSDKKDFIAILQKRRYQIVSNEKERGKILPKSFINDS